MHFYNDLLFFYVSLLIQVCLVLIICLVGTKIIYFIGKKWPFWVCRVGWVFWV
jgi:hypothetical protein